MLDWDWEKSAHLQPELKLEQPREQENDHNKNKIGKEGHPQLSFRLKINEKEHENVLTFCNITHMCCEM